MHNSKRIYYQNSLEFHLKDMVLYQSRPKTFTRLPFKLQGEEKSQIECKFQDHYIESMFFAEKCSNAYGNKKESLGW